MNELRQDRTTGRWTIIAPARQDRPHEAGGERTKGKSSGAASGPSCPFCPGNEGMLPRIIEEATTDAPPGWLTRVVPNKFPILASEGRAPADPPGTGYGIHEVIIETPRHDADLPDLSPAEMNAVVETWHRRFEAALARPGIEAVLLFRNHGRAAGASLGHPHSQLVGTSFVPARLAGAFAWACSRHSEAGECVTCRELALELEAGDRVVEVTDDFAVLVPFAAASPFEQWIVPRRHSPTFDQGTPQERTALAAAVQCALRRLDGTAGDVDYNLVIEPGSNETAHAEAAHWSARIVPDVTTPGGFEMLSGLTVNPSNPEEDARSLRACRTGSD